MCSGLCVLPAKLAINDIRALCVCVCVCRSAHTLDVMIASCFDGCRFAASISTVFIMTLVCVMLFTLINAFD